MATQYIGARYVPIVYTNPDDDSANWKSGVDYEPLTIVVYNGDSYTCKKAVPSGVGNPAENSAYWVKTGDFNASLLALQNEVGEIENNIGEIKNDITELSVFVTPEMFGAVGDGVNDDSSAIQAAIDFAITKGVYVKLIHKSYKIDNSILIDKTETAQFLFDGGESIINYTGIGYAFLISKLSYSTLNFGTISAPNGGCIKIYSGEVNHDRCQYLDINFHIMHALTNCVYGIVTENASNCWINEIRFSNGHFRAGAYGVNLECQNETGISRWCFDKVGFEGVDVGVYFNAQVSEISMCEFVNCRLQETITSFIKSYGYVRGIMCVFPSTYTISFNLLSILDIEEDTNHRTATHWKFIDTKGGVYLVTDGIARYEGMPETLSNGVRIMENEDLNDYLNIGNYFCLSNSEAATLSHCPTRGAFSLKVMISNGAQTSTTTLLIQKLINDSGVEYKRWIGISSGVATYGDWEKVATSSLQSETFTYNGLTVQIIGNDSCKYLKISGHPSNQLDAGTSYDIGQIDNTRLKPQTDFTNNCIADSAGTLVFVAMDTGGYITITPRANISTAGNTVAINTLFI